MPIVRCPECSAVVAWRGKSLTLQCPSDHGKEEWRGRTWHDASRMLDVDRDGIPRNGHTIDAHLPALEADARDRELEADGSDSHFRAVHASP